MTHIEDPPHDPQHPSDLFSSGGPSQGRPVSAPPQSGQQPSSAPPSWPSYQTNPNQNWGGVWGGGQASGGPWGGGWGQQQGSGMVPPEFDPVVDTSKLDRKTASYIQQEAAKWSRDTRYAITPEEGKPLLRPLRNLFFGLIAGTFAGRFVLTQAAPAMVQGHRSRSWLLGALLGGYPVGGCAMYLSQVSSIKEVLDKKTPLGVQARYLFRVKQAEKNGLPRPPSPFGSPPPQQPGTWASPYDQQQQQQFNQVPPQPLQWNTFSPQPQYPPPNPSNIQGWEGASAGGEKSPSQEPRYRSWDDIRKTSQQGYIDGSTSGGTERFV